MFLQNMWKICKHFKTTKLQHERQMVCQKHGHCETQQHGITLQIINLSFVCCSHDFIVSWLSNTHYFVLTIRHFVCCSFRKSIIENLLNIAVWIRIQTLHMISPLSLSVISLTNSQDDQNTLKKVEDVAMWCTLWAVNFTITIPPRDWTAVSIRDCF